ncbi:MAG: TrmB family transcriptional regulator sugar-binding domain-containing protein, partial [Thermoplasmataceae archaeon]
SHNFFNGWYNSMILRSRGIHLPAEYHSQRIAVDDLSRLLASGKEIDCFLEGRSMSSGKKITLSGRILSTNINSEVINFTVRSDGKTYTVGGYDSQIEDIEMTYLKIFTRQGETPDFRDSP